MYVARVSFHHFSVSSFFLDRFYRGFPYRSHLSSIRLVYHYIVDTIKMRKFDEIISNLNEIIESKKNIFPVPYNLRVYLSWIGRFSLVKLPEKWTAVDHSLSHHH